MRQGLQIAALLTLFVVVSSCGGKAVIDPGSTGVGGTGPATTSTTSTSGGTGGVAGSGGSGGNDPTCPPPPSCNWCGGTAQTNGQGCVVGYQCANGIDPCDTPPCQTNSDCPVGAVCDESGLCWPCEGGVCEIGGSGNNLICRCTSECGQGPVLSFECSTSSMGGNCDCYVDDQLVSICDIDGNPGDPCAIGFSCCHWPLPDDG